MVTITNGDVIVEVTAGAYETIYKRQGFEIVTDEEVTAGAETETTSEDTKMSPEAPEAEDGKDTNEGEDEGQEGDEDHSGEGEETEEADPFAELITKPVSQWSKQEMQEFAEANCIDTSKAKTVSDAKKIIAEYIDSIQ